MGLEMNLDKVPQREKGMTPYEMMLSESQERMLFVVEPKHEAQAREIFERWGVVCAKVGKVTDDGRLKLIHHDEVVGDMPKQAAVYYAASLARESCDRSSWRAGCAVS